MTEQAKTSWRGSRRRRWALCAGGPVLAVGLLWGSHAMAGPNCHGHRARAMHAESVQELQDRMQQRLDRMLTRLDATDAQRGDASRIVGETAQKLFPLHQSGRVLRSELRSELVKEQVDQARVSELAAEAETALAQVARVGIEAAGELAAVFDVSQRRKAAKFLARFAR